MRVSKRHFVAELSLLEFYLTEGIINLFWNDGFALCLLLLFIGIDFRQHLLSTVAHLLYKDIKNKSVKQANYVCIFMHALKVDCQIRCV